jgi:1,2-diacylglycerol 3-beta-galactosyltransferase
MPVLMAAADILVSKAGPATITEACIAGLPVILYDAIPGQETGNVDYVVQNQIGIYAPSSAEVAAAARAWLAEGPAGLKRRSDTARALARPEAVFDIAEEVWQHAQLPRIPAGRREFLELPKFLSARS